MGKGVIKDATGNMAAGQLFGPGKGRVAVRRGNAVPFTNCIKGL